MRQYLRNATRKDNEPLNILTFPTHERYESGLCLTGHNFYAFRGKDIKDWNTNYAPVPQNYQLLDQRLGEKQVPSYIDFDLVLSQNKFGQFNIARHFAEKLSIPLISLEHTLPFVNWSKQQIEEMQSMTGDINIFISDYSKGKWGFAEDPNSYVIKHMVDQSIFYPLRKINVPTERVEKNNVVLSVVNDWINRDWCCNFSGWQRVVMANNRQLPVLVLGDTPGLSKPASSTKELADTYRKSKIFFNTSTISPVPSALLEAMACGCAVVSTATCMIPEIIKNGYNGFISNDEIELRFYIENLLNNDDLAEEVGNNAVKTITNHFSSSRFINDWNLIFKEALSMEFFI